ncbi:MAG TPA: hypothetical protein EYG03_17315 [Planctomycetes bacterium]|nr:hypothetical protein [Planctomycetota bacterium]
MLFLLPLTTFERLVFFDDRPSAPWIVCLRLCFEGELDRDKAQEATQISLIRHPLLTSLVEQVGRDLVWQPASKELAEAKLQSVTVDGTYPNLGYMDIRRETGFRLFDSMNDGSSTLYFVFHHICLDGKGAFQFIGDWLIAYDRLCGLRSELPDFPKLDEQLLARRTFYGRDLWQRVKMIPHQSVGLLGAGEFAMHRPQPILPDAPTAGSDEAPEGFPPGIVHRFEPDELAALHSAGKDKGATVNDLLIRDVYLALNRWRIANDVNEPESWLRLMIPISVRSEFETEMPATNVVGSVFVDRRGRDCDDEKSLLEGICRQMHTIKRHELGFTFLWTLWLQRWLPGGLKKIVQGEKCLNSATFTNLGRLFEDLPLPRRDGFLSSGNMELLSVDGTAPLRPKNYAAFAVFTYANRMSISMHYNATAIPRTSAELLLEMLVAAIRESSRSD